MTIYDLDRSLPNGFHDAEVHTILLDQLARQVKMKLSVWVGDMDERVEAREAYREAELVIDGMQWIAIEPPDPLYPFAQGGLPDIDLAERESTERGIPRDLVMDGNFAARFFVRQWNSSIIFVARTATLTWTGATYARS